MALLLLDHSHAFDVGAAVCCGASETIGCAPSETHIVVWLRTENVRVYMCGARNVRAHTNNAWNVPRVHVFAIHVFCSHRPFFPFASFFFFVRFVGAQLQLNKYLISDLDSDAPDRDATISNWFKLDREIGYADVLVHWHVFVSLFVASFLKAIFVHQIMPSILSKFDAHFSSIIVMNLHSHTVVPNVVLRFFYVGNVALYRTQWALRTVVWTVCNCFVSMLSRWQPN